MGIEKSAETGGDVGSKEDFFFKWELLKHVYLLVAMVQQKRKEKRTEVQTNPRLPQIVSFLKALIFQTCAPHSCPPASPKSVI